MGLQTCRDCGKEVSTKAKRCPGCGREFSDWVDWLNVLVFGGVFFVGSLVAMYVGFRTLNRATEGLGYMAIGLWCLLCVLIEEVMRRR